MKNTRIPAFVLAALVSASAPGEDRAYFRDDLLFYASYDRSPDADFARGDGRAINPKGEGLVEGRFGQALRFERKRGVRVCEYAARKNVRPDEGAIAFYFKPDWSGQDCKIRYFFLHPGPKNRGGGANAPDSIGVQTMRYRKPEQELWLWYDDHGGGNNIVRGSIHRWAKREWRHVAVTWDSSWLHLYLDGELKGRHRVKGQVSEPGDRFFVGASRNGALSSEGVLDELYIYGRALSLAEIGLLTGKPKFVVPRIHSLTPLQSLFFQSETRVPFRCELTGRIDPDVHRLRCALSRQAARDPVASAALPPAATGRYALDLPRPLSEGSYTLQLALVDKRGKVLDQKKAPLRVLTGPFDQETR